MADKHHTLIIGAGPAGLAVAARLKTLQLPFEIIEKSGQVGHMWHEHYDRLCLHTVKELSHLPFLPFPDEYPRYVPRKAFADYLAAYAKHFDIQPQYYTDIQSLSREGTEWQAHARDGRNFTARNIVIATGVNRIPHWPSWKGMKQYKGTIIHSRSYRNPKPFRNKKVLVVGMGNTGAEIALDLAENDIEVAISVRSPVNIVPRDIFGRPTQLTGKMLEKLPWGLGDKVGGLVRKMVVGNLGPYGLETSTMAPAEQLRTTGQTPVIDLGTVSMIKRGKIDVWPDITSFDAHGVTLSTGEHRYVDQVILATGYRAQLEDLLGDVSQLVDQHGVPTSPVGTGMFAHLYFVGFDNYKLGGILGTIFTDSEKIVEAIASQ